RRLAHGDREVRTDDLAHHAAAAFLGLQHERKAVPHLQDPSLAVLDAEAAALAPRDLDPDLGRALVLLRARGDVGGDARLGLDHGGTPVARATNPSNCTV